MNKNGLSRISTSGKLDDWESALVNGLSPAHTDPAEVIWWRYGKWVPDVACTLCGSHLIVTGRVKARLASTRASFHRVKSLFVTDPDDDWRTWPDAEASRYAVLERYEMDEPEDLVCPTRNFRAPDPSQPLHELRHGRLVETRDADLWVVFGEESLQAQRKPSRYCEGRPGAGIYSDPFLYRSNVCVEDHVREILESFDALSTIEFEPTEVRWTRS